MPEFTPDQLEGVRYRALDACVVAGPGSGKTTVLVERYRSLVEDHRFEPRQILAITFTEKAAANMKAKLAAIFAHDPDRVRDLESAWVSTIHGFCARVLRENAIAAGIDPRFSVLDARESELLEASSVHAALDEMTAQRREEMLALIDALHSPSIWYDVPDNYDAIRSAGLPVTEVRRMSKPANGITVQSVISELTAIVQGWPAQLPGNQDAQRADILEWAERVIAAKDAREALSVATTLKINLNQVPKQDKAAVKDFRENRLADLLTQLVDCAMAPFRALVMDALGRFDEIYTDRKIARGALDFNDLERRTVELLRKNEEVRGRIRAQFRQVMLDEFQDINQQQWELIELLRADDVFFAVGDINQSIYGFRHARPAIFEAYRAHIREKQKHSVSLIHNFRSRDPILRCVESLLNSKPGIEARELVASAMVDPKSAPCIEILKAVASDEGAEPDQREAGWIAHRICELRGSLQLGVAETRRTADYGDFAVLCRNSESMKPILEAFDRMRIPYVSGRRPSFLRSREGLDITALLETILNPRNSVALTTVLRSPLVAVSDEALLRLRLLAHSVPGGLNLAAYDSSKLAGFAPQDAAKVTRFASDLKRWRSERAIVPLDVLLIRALNDCGFEWAPGTDVANNVESYLHLARTLGSQRDLREFLNELGSLEEAFDFDSDLSDTDQGNAVRVMTAHGAKGLEFPVTIIAAMHKGVQRNSAAMTFTPTHGIGIRWRDPSGGESFRGLKDSWQRANGDEIATREEEESNRLLYVAMTRAEEHLILSYSCGKGKPKEWAKMIEEAFAVDSLEPASEPYIRALNAGGGKRFDVSVRVTASDAPQALAVTAGAAQNDGVVTVPRPNVTGQHDSSVNVTSLTVFAQCPRKYYLQRYLGWNISRFESFDADTAADGSDDLSAAELGSAVHEILAGKNGSHRAEARQLAGVFTGSELGARAAASSQSAREWEFIIDIEGTLVRGTVDLWFRDNDEIEIVDYKTDRVVNASQYAPQLALYALALERALGKRPSHAWLHYLRSNTLVEVSLDYDVTHLIARLREAQNSLRFDVNSGTHCGSCQYYRSLCPAG